MMLEKTSEQLLDMFALWKNPNPEGKRVLIPICPGSLAEYAIIVTCADPRFLQPQCGHFNGLYTRDNASVPRAYVLTEFGGAVRLAHSNPHGQDFFTGLLRNLDDFESLVGDPKATIDLWLCGHIECKWCIHQALSLRDLFDHLTLVGARLEGVLSRSRYKVRFGFHHYWPRSGNHKTYEIDPKLALDYLNDLNPIGE